MDDIIVYIDEIRPLILIFAGRVILALSLLIIGFLLIRLARQGLKRILVLRGVDESLHQFLCNIFSIGLKVILLISVISILGIETTSFIAVIGSAGLAIGLALQGSLSNFAGGVLILTIKPFRKGDFITSMGDSGTVHTINIFNTILKTPDNQTVHIPNGKLAGSTIINFSEEPTRRLVINIGISYKEEVAKAKNILKAMIEEEEKILKEPVPQVIMNAFNESSINLAIRVWCKKEDYWEVNFALHEKLKQRFDENNISIPFPQRELHLKR